MIRYYHLIKVLLLATLFVNCKQESISADEIVNQAIIFSGGDRFKTSRVCFDFREINYCSYNLGNNRILSREFFKNGENIKDRLGYDGFIRLINDSIVAVADSMAIKYENALNSVHYFARLPYGLNDAAVNKQNLGKVNIKNKWYYKIKVTFAQEGGGVDYQDVFIYWFDVTDFSMDFLAYSYHTDGGGYRLREAKNQRRVGGILFSDYKNFKPKDDATVTLDDLENHLLKGDLVLLSHIELRNIEVNPNLD